MRLVHCFREVARQLGLQTDDAWASAGFSRDDLSDLDSTIPLDIAERFLTAAIEITGVHDFGIRAAEAAEPGFFDLVEYAARSQPTLRQALASLCRLVPILANFGGITAREENDTATISLFTVMPVPIHPAMVEFTFAQLQIEARRLTRRPDLNPDAMHFRHSAPPDTSPHQALFRAPVHFGADVDKIVFSSWQLDLPLVTADSHLSALLDKIVTPVLANLEREVTLVDRVRNKITERMPKGGAAAPDIARALGMTQRTLHRRLTEEGVKFRDLVAEVRKTLSLAYMKEPRLSIAEIAYLLGFSDVSAFHRAFRRWTNETPRSYRSHA
jgi:AraC-like DNA-binding protein